MTTENVALEVPDPDSLDDDEQEPWEGSGDEPAAEEPASAAEPETPAAATDADAAGQPDAESAAPAEATDGPARDAQGRFAPKASTPGQAAPAEPSQPIAEASPPFSFRLDGLAVEVEGATEKDGTITLSKDAWQRHVQPRLADRGKIQAREARHVGRIRELEQESQAREERFGLILKNVDAILSDKQKLIAFAQNFEAESPRFRLQIENEILRSDTKRKEQATQQSAAQAEEREFVELAQPRLPAAIKQVVTDLGIKAQLDSATLESIASEVWAMHESGIASPFFRVKENDGSGIDPRESKWGVDFDRLARIAGPHIKLAAQAATRAVQTQKAEEVAKANAAVLGKAKNTPPPTAPAQASPTPGGAAKYPTTPEEYAAWKDKRARELNIPLG